MVAPSVNEERSRQTVTAADIESVLEEMARMDAAGVLTEADIASSEFHPRFYPRFYSPQVPRVRAKKFPALKTPFVDGVTYIYLLMNCKRPDGNGGMEDTSSIYAYWFSGKGRRGNSISSPSYGKTIRACNLHQFWLHEGNPPHLHSGAPLPEQLKQQVLGMENEEDVISFIRGLDKLSL